MTGTTGWPQATVSEPPPSPPPIYATLQKLRLCLTSLGLDAFAGLVPTPKADGRIAFGEGEEYVVGRAGVDNGNSGVELK